MEWEIVKGVWVALGVVVLIAFGALIYVDERKHRWMAVGVMAGCLLAALVAYVAGLIIWASGLDGA